MEADSNAGSVPASYWLEGFARQAEASDPDEREQLQEWYTALLRPHMPRQPGLALDIGCGRGRVIRAVATLAPGCRCVGIDGDERTLAIARRELAEQRIEAALYRLDVTEPGFTRILTRHYDRFSVITSLFVLHHYSASKAAAILRELRGVLAPGGVMVLAEAHDPNCHQAELAEQVCAELGAMAGRAPDLLWSQAELIEACQGAGLTQNELHFEAAPGSPFTPAEEAANCQALERLRAQVLAAETQVVSVTDASRLGHLKRVVAKMVEYGIARPSRLGPLLAILRPHTSI